MRRHLVLILAVLAVGGCGSEAAAELPAPAGMALGAQRDGAFTIDRAHDRLTRADGVSVATGREPTAVRILDRGKKVAVLCGRERVLEIYDARTLQRLGRTGAGIGPTGLATDGVQVLYVTDVLGDALLVFRLRPRFELIRRVHVIGGPYAIGFDRERWGLWIALSKRNVLLNYAAGFRPVPRATKPTIPNARAVSVVGDLLTVSSQADRQVLRLRSK